MSSTIDVELDQLENFISALENFQTRMNDQLAALQPSWDQCDETWKGVAKDSFQKEFEETLQSIHSLLEAGDDSVAGLKQFREIVDEFESGTN